ncbi:MAG TPA: hypothetical protein PLA90_10405, partial [Candidatus Sumerlaeota bacterium]|nr:hypothetical protein [Candidatus Sumerlaeota bacterium]
DEVAPEAAGIEALTRLFRSIQAQGEGRGIGVYLSFLKHGLGWDIPLDLPPLGLLEYIQQGVAPTMVRKLLVEKAAGEIRKGDASTGLSDLRSLLGCFPQESPALLGHLPSAEPFDSLRAEFCFVPSPLARFARHPVWLQVGSDGSIWVALEGDGPATPRFIFQRIDGQGESRGEIAITGVVRSQFHVDGERIIVALAEGLAAYDFDGRPTGDRWPCDPDNLRKFAFMPELGGILAANMAKNSLQVLYTNGDPRTLFHPDRDAEQSKLPLVTRWVPIGGILHVHGWLGNRLMAVDLSGVLLGETGLPDLPVNDGWSGLAFAPTGHMYLSSCFTGMIWKLTATGQLLYRAELPGDARASIYHMVGEPGGNALLAADHRNCVVWRIGIGRRRME